MLAKHQGRMRAHKLLAKSGYGKGGAARVAGGAGSEDHDGIKHALADAERETRVMGDGAKKRLDRKPRAAGGRSGIHIKPSHKGLLTKEVGKKGLTVKNLRKEIAHDKAAGNVAREKREVFALNAKTKFKH